MKTAKSGASYGALAFVSYKYKIQSVAHDQNETTVMNTLVQANE